MCAVDHYSGQSFEHRRDWLDQRLLFELQDYLRLVGDTGRILRNDKHGAIQTSSRQILERLNISQETWFNITQEFMNMFKGPVGSLPELSDGSVFLTCGFKISHRPAVVELFPAFFITEESHRLYFSFKRLLLRLF
ncbi:MAG: hypothetical protein WBH20_12440 [Oceanisphaera sp.]